MDVIAWERDVRLIGELCVELVGLGMKVRLTDARPSLFVRCVGDDQLHRIEVRSGGQCFVWAGGRHHHAVSDPKGAASRIAVFVRQAVPPGPDSHCCGGPIVCEVRSLAAPGVGEGADPAELVKRLVEGCQGAGLEAVVLAPTRVRVNRRGGTSLMAKIITLKPDGAEVSCWWWPWNEPICPAVDIDQAVAVIADVVLLLDS